MLKTWVSGLDDKGSKQGPVAGRCKHDNVAGKGSQKSAIRTTPKSNGYPKTTKHPISLIENIYVSQSRKDTDFTENHS